MVSDSGRNKLYYRRQDLWIEQDDLYGHAQLQNFSISGFDRLLKFKKHLRIAFNMPKLNMVKLD